MEYIVAEETNHFCTIDEKTVVFLEAHLDRITFVDLSTHTFRHVPKVFEEKKKLNTISYFGKSRCYCVWEQLQNKIMFRFSYFFLEDDKPFHVYESVDKNYDLLVKVDDSSKFLWLQTKQNQTLTFSTYEFNQGGKGVLRSFKLNNNVDRQLLPNS